MAGAAWEDISAHLTPAGRALAGRRCLRGRTVVVFPLGPSLSRERETGRGGKGRCRGSHIETMIDLGPQITLLLSHTREIVSLNLSRELLAPPLEPGLGVVQPPRPSSSRVPFISISGPARSTAPFGCSLEPSSSSSSQPPGRDPRSPAQRQQGRRLRRRQQQQQH